MAVPPDVVRVARAVLTAPGALASWPAVFVSSDLDGFQQGSSWVWLQGTGGSVVDARRLFAPRVDAACYARTQNEARLLCLDVFAVLLGVSGLVGNASVSGVEAVTYPLDVPDEVNQHPRSVCSVAMFVRPSVGV